MSTLRSHVRGLFVLVAIALGAFTASPLLAQHGEPSHGEEVVHEAGELADETSEHGEHHEPHWDYFQFAGQLTNFAIWLTLLYILLNRVMPKLLADRRAGIVDGLEEAKRMKTEAEAKFAEYSKRIDTMDAELDRVREDMRKAGQAERDRLVSEASEKAARMHAEARFLVEQQMKQLKEELTREAIESAVVAAEAILRQGTSAADQQRLADEYLARLKTSASKNPQPGASS
ncbi:MAG: ATP synthase F0 subunit B [Deltaproteobacteria bacterium]|nr:ATP synthase F0 subunit B [Deltaproteobacteria bacterium]